MILDNYIDDGMEWSFNEASDAYIDSLISKAQKQKVLDKEKEYYLILDADDIVYALLEEDYCKDIEEIFEKYESMHGCIDILYWSKIFNNWSLA